MSSHARAQEDIIHAVARLLGLPGGQVLRSSRLEGDLGIDAFDAAELIDELERLYDTELPEALHQPEGLRRSFQTVEDIERALARTGELDSDDRPREKRPDSVVGRNSTDVHARRLKSADDGLRQDADSVEVHPDPHISTP